MNEWRVLQGWRNWKAVRVGFRTIVHTTGLQVCSSDSSSSAIVICNIPIFSQPRFEAAQTWQVAHVLQISVSVQFGCQSRFFLTREFPWIVIYFYFILMSCILFSKTDTLEYISYHQKKKKKKSTRTKPSNLKLTANSRWLKISIKTDPLKKQEQGVVPVNDHSKTTAESASTQKTDSIPALQKAWVPPHPGCTLLCKAWVPPHPQCTAHKGQILLLCKAWVPPHPWRMACKSSKNPSEILTHGCSHTQDVLRVLYNFVVCLLLCLFILTPISVSTGTNPSLTKS